jgi:hypothetical protein
LQAQARAAISAQGNMAQHTPGHVNPFRQVPAHDASPLHAPNPEAVPGKSTLSTRHPREIAVQQETVEYHPPVSSEHDAEPAHYGISPAQKLSRAERVRALNAELGIAADNKTHLPGHAATERHAQAEVAIDPNVEPGRSIAQDFKGGVRSYDEAEGSGRDEAARPAHPRNPGV